MGDKLRMKEYRATVRDSEGETQEVPVWAPDLDTALEVAEAEYTDVDRVRPVVAP